MNKLWLAAGLLILIAGTSLLGIFASESPDGLEKVAEEMGFAAHETDHPPVNGIAPDYSVPGISNDKLSGGLAGLGGIVLTFGITWGVGAYAARKRVVRRG